MDPRQNNQFGGANWESWRARHPKSQDEVPTWHDWNEPHPDAQEEASFANDPDSSQLAPQAPSAASSRGVFSDPASRRRFLRTTVIAGAAVTGVAAAAGGLAYAAQGQAPRILSSLRAGNAAPSGHCVEITQGVKGSASNPNQHIQVSTSDFQTYIGTISGTMFTITHGVAVLVDKNGHNPNLSTCIKGAAYDNGNTGQVILTVDPGVTTTTEYPAQSCLYVNQSLGTC